MPPTPTSRVLSLDVFRGLTVAAMILVNNPGDWNSIYWPLAHAAWHGTTPTDWIFPFFLFIVGVSLCFSRKGTHVQVLKRSAFIAGLGWLMAAYPYFQISTLRWPGVLPRIAVCYLAAWLVKRHFGVTGAAVLVPILLGGYAWAMLVPDVPGIGPANLAPDTNFAAYVDRLFLTGHMWRQTKTWDPEGLFSTLPAIATTLLGILAGWILRSDFATFRKIAILVGSGLALAAAGAAWHPYFPMNKSLWTSSYVLFTGGLAAWLLGLFHWLIDVEGWRWGLSPAPVFGRNAILVFAASGLVAKTLGLVRLGGPENPSLQAAIYGRVFVPLASPHMASLLYALVNLVLWYLLLQWLDRRGVRLSV